MNPQPWSVSKQHGLGEHVGEFTEAPTLVALQVRSRLVEAEDGFCVITLFFDHLDACELADALQTAASEVAIPGPADRLGTDRAHALKVVE